MHWDELHATAQAEDKKLRDAAIHSMWELMDFCGKPDLKLPQPFGDTIHHLLLFGLFATNSWLAVNMVTDLFGTDERFNVPGSAGDTNWTQRLSQRVANWNQVYAGQLASVEIALKEANRG